MSGNRKPQTFRNCEQCHNRFGPLDNLTRRFCSRHCWYKSRRTGHRTIRRTLTIARSAQSLVGYHIKKGHFIRPDICPKCQKKAFIEAAHYDYRKPKRFQWLCRSCHRKWDKREPKNATVIVQRWEDFTGQKAKLIK